MVQYRVTKALLGCHRDAESCLNSIVVLNESWFSDHLLEILLRKGIQDFLNDRVCKVNLALFVFNLFAKDDNSVRLLVEHVLQLNLLRFRRFFFDEAADITFL